MSAFLLDTDICIYAIKAMPRVVQRLRDVQVDGLYLSVMTLHELLYGAERSRSTQQALTLLKEFVAPFTVLDVNSAVAAHAAKHRATLARQGTPIGPYDLLIAATALAHDLVLVSNNMREFMRIDGLQVENWAV